MLWGILCSAQQHLIESALRFRWLFPHPQYQFQFLYSVAICVPPVPRDFSRILKTVLDTVCHMTIGLARCALLTGYVISPSSFRDCKYISKGGYPVISHPSKEAYKLQLPFGLVRSPFYS